MAASSAQSATREQQQHQQLMVQHQQSPMVDELRLEVKAWWLSHLIDMVRFPFPPLKLSHHWLLPPPPPHIPNSCTPLPAQLKPIE